MYITSLFVVTLSIFPQLSESSHDSHQVFHQKSIFDIAYEYMEGQGDLLLNLEEYLPEEGKVALYDLIDVLDIGGEFNDTRPICDTCKVNIVFFSLFNYENVISCYLLLI